MPKQKNIFLKMLPLFLVLFIDSMGLGLIFPILQSLILDSSTNFLSSSVSHSAREITYGVIIGIFMLSWFFGAAILGDLSDMVGRKKALIICLIGTCVGYLLAAIAVAVGSLSLLIIGRIIAGFTSGSQPISQAAIIDESDSRYLPKNMSLMILFITLGFVFGPILGGVLSDKNILPMFNFYTPLYFASTISLLNIILLFWLFKEPPFKNRPLSIKLHNAINVFISAFKHPKIKFMSLYFLIMLIGWSGYYTFIGEYARQTYQLSPLEVSMFMGALGLGYALGAGFIINIFNKYLKVKATISISLILASIFMLAYLIIPAQTQILAWINTIIIGIFGIIAWSNLMVLFSHQVKEHEQGWVMGVTGSIMALSFAIISFFMGSLINHFSINFPIINGAVCMFIAGVLFLFSKFK